MWSALSPVIELLRELIAIPSVNPSDGQPDNALYGEARVVDCLAAFFRSARVDCARQEALPGRDNLVAVVEGRSPHPVILEAHTDTVAVEGMEIDPFDPAIRDGRVHGRGACDDKGSLAAMAVALAEAAQAGTPERTLVLAATCDEEYRFGGVNAFVNDPGAVGIKPEHLRRGMACVGEPTGLQVVIAHKGAFRWRMRTRGKAAHSSNPDAGINAIYDMARLVQRLEQYADSLRDRPAHPLVGGPAFSVGIIRGGAAVNIVPDLCEALVDRRLIPGEDGAAAEKELRAFLGDAVPYEMETLLEDWPLETPRDAEVVRRAEAAVREALGRAAVVGAQYGTDASKLHRGGVQSVVCGPGDIAQAHTAVEWVEIAQVEAAKEVYRRILG